jgi:hypothetical protein
MLCMRRLERGNRITEETYIGLHLRWERRTSRHSLGGNLVLLLRRVGSR